MVPTSLIWSCSINIRGSELTTTALEHLQRIYFTRCYLKNDIRWIQCIAKFFMFDSTHSFGTMRHLEFHIFVSDGAKHFFCLILFRFFQLIKYRENIVFSRSMYSLVPKISSNKVTCILYSYHYSFIWSVRK